MIIFLSLVIIALLITLISAYVTISDKNATIQHRETFIECLKNKLHSTDKAYWNTLKQIEELKREKEIPLHSHTFPYKSKILPKPTNFDHITKSPKKLAKAITCLSQYDGIYYAGTQDNTSYRITRAEVQEWLEKEKDILK